MTEALSERTEATVPSSMQGSMHVDFEWDGNHGVLKDIEAEENTQIITMRSREIMSG